MGAIQPLIGKTLHADSVCEGFCSRYLMEAQNADGGWGYQPGSDSSVEPTSWALLALTASSGISTQGLQWLCRVQLSDGSWPAYRGQTRGCWTTALACLALQQFGSARQQVQRGVQWLLSTWPAEYRLWWRMRSRFSRDARTVRQDCALPGWGWTPCTASWVEPTSCALILLRQLTDTALAAASCKRKRLAERMLRDRMCPDGGWNSGNPMVYGVAGEPRVGPTAWALLALHDGRGAIELESSLDWLQNACTVVRSPWSVALGYMALKAHQRHISCLGSALSEMESASDVLWNVPAAALTSMALSGRNPLAHARIG